MIADRLGGRQLSTLRCGRCGVRGVSDCRQLLVVIPAEAGGANMVGALMLCDACELLALQLLRAFLRTTDNVTLAVLRADAKQHGEVPPPRDERDQT